MNRNMDFILGVLVGASLMIAWGYILHRKKGKAEITQTSIHIAELKKVWAGFRISPEDLEYLNSYPRQPKPDLEQQLSAALDREDYKEAARLRDLMNKG